MTFGILTCFLIAGIGGWWAMRLTDSLYGFRSPLQSNPPAPGLPLGEPLAERVVFVLIDALRADTAYDPGVMPFLNELRRQGASALMHSRAPSYSAPGYGVLLTGAWPELSDGPVFNPDAEDFWVLSQDNIFSAARRNGLQTAISAYFWFERMLPAEAVTYSFYTEGEDEVADQEVIAAALPWLESGEAQLVLIHIDQVDHAGHLYGADSPEWAAAARRADDHLRAIAASLDFERDVLFVCSDHGQIDQGGHGGHEPVVLREPFVLAGAKVKPGDYGVVQMVDVAPTLAFLLGANIPASSQGRARTEMLQVPVDRLKQQAEAVVAQQAALTRAYTTAIGRPAEPVSSDDPVAAAQQVMAAARSARLRAERPGRSLLAAFFVVAPLAILLWRRPAWKSGLPIAVGVMLYLIVFNLLFVFASHYGYSLTTIPGLQEMIMAYLWMGAVSLAAAALAVFGINGSFRRLSQTPALLLALVLGIEYVLWLPIWFNFALYGPLVTWALPDFAHNFWQIFGQIQSIVVALVGLLLVGSMALLARIFRRSTT